MVVAPFLVDLVEVVVVVIIVGVVLDFVSIELISLFITFVNHLSLTSKLIDGETMFNSLGLPPAILSYRKCCT